VDLTTFQSLDSVFNNVREVPVKEEILCDPNQWTWEEWDGHINTLNLTHWATGKTIHIWPTGIASEEPSHGAAQFFTGSLRKIRKAFTFRKRFREAAQNILSNMASQHVRKVNRKRKGKKVKQSQVEFVCVHIRRKDHLEYEEINGVRHLTKHYFTQAMDYFKETVPHALFVIVSDDPDWAKTQIHRDFKPYFTGFYNESLQDSAGLDMAVLASCNFTVLSRGTFGLWGNILSGSPRLLPKHFYPVPVWKPLSVEHQTPLLDLSHRWMDPIVRAGLATVCPHCVTPWPREEGHMD